MEDIAYLFVPLAQIAFGAATIGAILLAVDNKRSVYQAFLVPIVGWGWVLAAISTTVFITVVKVKYPDPDNAPEMFRMSTPALSLYGALVGMVIGSLIGVILGVVRWNRWSTSPSQP